MNKAELVRAKIALTKKSSLLPYLIGGGLGLGGAMLLGRDGNADSELPKPAPNQQPLTIGDRLAKKPVMRTGQTLRQKIQTGAQNVAQSEVGQFFSNLFNRYFKK